MTVYGRIFMTIVVVVGLSLAKTNDVDDFQQFCNSEKTCAACIGKDVQCSWCYDKIYARPRCDLARTHTLNGCNKSNILNPSMKFNLIQDESLSDQINNKILIKPQKIRLQIRPHETANIPFKFQTTKDHAVDMYFLMDLSYTMKQYINELSKVTRDLVKNIRNLTGSLQFGIGSFVDKMTLPYGWCDGKTTCGYSFMQSMKLTENYSQFKKIVSKLQNMTTTNFDTPEGGLDALMQAVVCGNEIGWRANSRKVIIYCSDAPFHFAGDGQLGGMVIPNDGNCHMKNDRYTKELIQDYPSVDHIAQVVQKHQITVIFAVAGRQYQQLYRNLSNGLTSSYVNELGSQTSNIADIVTEGYKNITSTVEMKADSNNFQVDFWTNCSNGQWTKSEKCRGIKLGQVVHFQSKITAPACPKGNHSHFQTIKIHPINSDHQLEIEIELLCECNCNDKEQNSQMCNGNGWWHCGECICNEGWSGKNCACDRSQTKSDKLCYMGNSTQECSDRGSCECGECICRGMASNNKQTYSGTYCECDDYSCPYYNGSLCGGPSRGICKCGQCDCRSEFKGADCHCPTGSENCMSKNNEVCNGHGQCECGVCNCKEGSGFIGDHCENCPTCNNWCELNKKCVECWMSKNGGNMSECARPCKNEPTMVDKMATDNVAKDGSKICTVEIDKCIIQYQTIIVNGIESIHISRKKDCPESNTTGMVIGIVIGILVLGILILVIWKIVTSILDRRELALFNEEKANAAWTAQLNPLFVQSSTTYENPTWVLNG